MENEFANERGKTAALETELAEERGKTSALQAEVHDLSSRVRHLADLSQRQQLIFSPYAFAADAAPAAVSDFVTGSDSAESAESAARGEIASNRSLVVLITTTYIIRRHGHGQLIRQGQTR